MDPNATLRQLRALASMPHYPLELDSAWDEITEAFNALDDWLSRGGFPPHAWERSADS